MRISDWSSDVCSSDLLLRFHSPLAMPPCSARLSVIDPDTAGTACHSPACRLCLRILALLTTACTQPPDHVTLWRTGDAATNHLSGSPCRSARNPRHRYPSLSSSSRSGRPCRPGSAPARSEEHTSELQSLMRTSYAVFCLKK